MPVPTTWTYQQLAALEQAFADSVLEISFGDRTLRYASKSELLKAINELRQSLATADAGGTPRSRISRVVTDKGF